jgi:hypothetical protein
MPGFVRIILLSLIGGFVDTCIEEGNVALAALVKVVDKALELIRSTR